MSRYWQITPTWQRVMIACALLLLVAFLFERNWLMVTAMALLLTGQVLTVRTGVKRSRAVSSVDAQADDRQA